MAALQIVIKRISRSVGKSEIFILASGILDLPEAVPFLISKFIHSVYQGGSLLLQEKFEVVHWNIH